MKGKDGRRIERLADLIREEVSRLLIKEIKDPRIGMITVTAVEVSRDIRTAKIFYTVGADGTARREAQKGLESAAGFIRSSLAAGLTIRRVPELTFIYDKSSDYGEKIDRILEELKKE